MKPCFQNRFLRSPGRIRDFPWHRLLLGLLAFVFAMPTRAADPSDEKKKWLTFESPQSQQWRMGLILNTNSTNCHAITATFPVPSDWPEQKVKLIDKEIDHYVTHWKTRVLPGGAKQVLLKMKHVPAGTTVKMLLTFEIERTMILGPEATNLLRIPKRISRRLRRSMGNSPYIDTSNSSIRTTAKKIGSKPDETDWQKVERFYDWVRENLEYKEGEIKSASQALRERKGDCEEMTSLFVAFCRNHRIPARMVWVPGHCYPEFYLVDPQGQGHWFPCQAAGTRQFGRMEEYRPILQKGDRFKVPEVAARQRYVAEFFSCKKVVGSGKPRPRFIQEIID